MCNLCPGNNGKAVTRTCPLPPLPLSHTLYSGSRTFESSQITVALNLAKYMLNSCYSPRELSIHLYTLLNRDRLLKQSLRKQPACSSVFQTGPVVGNTFISQSKTSLTLSTCHSLLRGERREGSFEREGELSLLYI